MFVWNGLKLVTKMQTNFRKQEDDVLKDLFKDRDKTAEEIGYLLSQRDSINCDIAELRDRLRELNDDIDVTKHENTEDAKKEEDEFAEILNSGDYSTLAREYRKLNTKLYEGRKRGWYTFMENTSYPSEGEVRQQRRDIGDRMLEAEMKKYELDGKVGRDDIERRI